MGELGDLEDLNKELAKKGGQVVGVNSFTLDGNKGDIADAKDVLSKKGVTYKNIWFKSDSEAGKFTSNLFSFPDHLRYRPERQHRRGAHRWCDYFRRAACGTRQAYRPGDCE